MWTRLAERPEAARLFDEAMQGLTQGVNGPLTTNYPFEKFGWIVDVGGGNGSLLLPVVEHHPAMRLTIFDLPHVADAVRGQIAAAGLSDRCEAVGGDAFVAVPGGADAYVLKGVIHDWEDEEAVVPTANPKQLTVTRDRLIIVAMGDLFKLIWWAAVGLFRPRSALQAEILVLRHQLNVLRRRSPKRVAVSNIDRLVFTGLYRLAPDALDALKILKPETVIRWHRAGFRAWWRWKSRPRGGRPKTPAEVRQLICEMSLANPLWGAPRIHGELRKLGIDVGQTTVAKYMSKR